MANRANSADPRHQRWHLVEWAALTQLLETTKLRDVEACILDAAVFVQVQRDLRMAFNAGHRIDDDGAFRLHDVSLLASSGELRATSSLHFLGAIAHCSSLVARSRSKPGFQSDIRIPSGEQLGNDVVNRVGRRRAAGDEYIDSYELVHRARRRQQSWHDQIRDAGIESNVFAIGAVVDGFRSKGIAHPWHIGSDGAVAE